MRIIAPIVGSEVFVKTRPKFLLLVFTMLFLKKWTKPGMIDVVAMNRSLHGSMQVLV